MSNIEIDDVSSDCKTDINTTLNSYRNISSKIKLILDDLELYVNEMNIFKFGVKIMSSGSIKIYGFVDFNSKTLYFDLREVFIKYKEYYITLKEYIHPLDDKYIKLIEKKDKYKKIPFYIKILGNTVKYMYIEQIINSEFKILSRNIKLSMINYLMNQY